MAVNRQFYIYKFNSKILQDQNYDINITFKKAKENCQIVAVADSQMLRSIRDIKNRYIDKDLIEMLFVKRNEYKKLPPSKSNSSLVREINKQINEKMFVPEYVSVVIDSISHYKKIIKNGIKINGKKYVRISCSASQARVNTIIMVEESISDELYKRLVNGMHSKKINPSKFNAYFGLSSSATKVVSNPNVCVVPDHLDKRPTLVNWVTEIDEPLKDDIIDEKIVDFEYNYFDGQGLISPNLAKKWAEELDLDYIPAEFCIRNAFIKGMVCVFDFVDFCKIKNNNNYIIKDIYGIEKDLRNVDLIISESQFKMWDCYDNFDEYEKNCEKNKLYWGVSRYSPKYDKDILVSNYQSLQTLKFDDKGIEDICNLTMDWIKKVSYKDILYTILFLLGENINEESVVAFLKYSDNYWLKCLLLDNELIKDKYIQEKIHDSIKSKISKACLGEILLYGNYQVLVSDPYAMMEHICGMPVVGLLGNKEHYCNYWNVRNVSVVDAMRSPLTYRSEHNILHLKKNNDTEYWYKYINTGVILNVHGDDVIRFADSDFDMDIVATTSNNTIINGVFTDTLPVAYQKKTTEKKELTFEDLCKADMLAFGSDIGQITNKSTSMYSMLYLYDEQSDEYKEILKRLIMTRVAQGNSIDKAKGVCVKEFPKHWYKYQHISDNDTEEIKAKKQLFNNILIEKRPYFFTYLYKHVKDDYKKYVNGRNEYCRVMFGSTVDELRLKPDKTQDEVVFLSKYDNFMPVINTPCEMNKICWRIEKFQKELKNDLNTISDDECWKKYVSDFVKDDDLYKKIKSVVIKYFKETEEFKLMRFDLDKNKYNDEEDNKVENIYSKFKENMNDVCSNTELLVNYLVPMFYTDIKSKNKDILWKCYGKHMFKNLKDKTSKFIMPVANPLGEINYLGKNFASREVLIND